MEALRAGRRHVSRLWLEDGDRPNQHELLQEIIGLAESQSIPARSVRGGLFDKLANQNANAQGVALEVEGYPYVALEAALARNDSRKSSTELSPLVLILDHVQDPQNLGTLFRTAEAMGVQAIILPDRRAAGITPAVVNASSGATEHLSIAQVTNLNRAIDELKESGYWIAGLDDASDASTIPAPPFPQRRIVP